LDSKADNPKGGRSRPGWLRLSPAEWALRLVTYLAGLALIAAAVGVARLDSGRAPLQAATAPAATPTARPAAQQLIPDPAALAKPSAGETSLVRLASLHTTIPTRPRYTIDYYTVQKNDTLFGIAVKFNLEPETILWGNPELADDPNVLSPGKELVILPTNGVLRVVQPGDTLEKIAKAFHGDITEIVNYPGNELDPADPQLREGQAIIIPGGWRDSVVWQLPAVTRTTVGSAYSADPGACAGPFSGPVGTFTFAWPANNQYLSGWDYMAQGHPGLDFSTALGAPIYASDSGVVVFAGWSNWGYGNMIMIDHGNGWQTVYAHLSQINVVCGQGVYQGNLIGLAGSTGNSSGPHLHFEMRHSTYGRVNPWLYLGK
jgi:LysM repeat protein